MAVSPRDIGVTREEAAKWIADWKRAQNLPGQKKSLRDHLEEKIKAKDLPDRNVNTTGHEQLEASTDVIEMILLDIDSYA